MGPIIRISTLFVLWMIALPAQADWFQSWHWGLDYQHIWAQGKGDWNDILDDQHPGANGYFGGRIYDWMGLEFGYSTTTRKRRQLLLLAGGQKFGIVNTSGQNMYIAGKMRLKNTHVDVLFYIPVYCDFEVLASGGLGWSRQSLDIGTSQPLSTLGSAIAQTQGRTKMVYRAGFGLQRMFWKNSGLRMMLRYDSLSRVRFRTHPLNLAGHDALKDGVTFSIGGVWNIG